MLHKRIVKPHPATRAPGSARPRRGTSGSLSRGSDRSSRYMIWLYS